MTRVSFRGDPYMVLGVGHDATPAAIKARWRRLARQHHPDLAGADPQAASEATSRMARINGAYDLLSDQERRAAWDRRHGIAHAPGWAGDRRFVAPQPGERPAGPPRPRPATPVTGRVDASALYRARNATTTPPGMRASPPGLPPRSRHDFAPPREPLRASEPCGPVRRRSGRAAPRPTLAEALDAALAFGRFRGHTLGEVAAFEPTYIDWVARTISHDRDLVVAARVVREELDRLGVPRRHRASTPGFGVRRDGRGEDRESA